MRDFVFATGSAQTIPTHNRGMTIVTVLLHLILLLVLIRVKTQPVRVSSAGAVQVGIAAYVPGSVASPGTSAAKPAIERKTTTTTTTTTTARVAKTVPKEDQSDAAQPTADAAQLTGGAGTPGGQAGSGPVRLGAGGSLTLVNKVTPLYPAIMQSARFPGQVVLDAIIHHDGTIGDVTVLRSTNDAFAQAAIVAVKQWRYTPIPYEGILTVTVNFTMPR
jgi:TonB family protein